ncbi:MAG: Mur ligase family protein [Syntrophomonadaceae bacterium]|nr:Mur ligase family protein [Syntrophomonadaceae bacterium]
MTALLTALDNPQQGLNCVHIAGTNGKGSTSMMIAHMLHRAGYRCARFSSPHLHSYRERFTIGGRPVAADRVYAALQQVKAVVPDIIARGGEHPTEFEVLTAMAFLLFRQERAEIAVLEVGMGGSFDSTNVIVPLLAVITGIDYDHTAFLGGRLEEIAANKAGIIKPGVPVLIGTMPHDARAVVAARARQLQAPLLDTAGVSVTLRRQSLEGQVLDIAAGKLRLTDLKFNLVGEYQRLNLALAVKAVQYLRTQGYSVDDAALTDALATAVMPGRMEIMSREPLIILDAAHNPQGARAVSAALRSLLPDGRGLLLCGLLDDKELKDVIDPLAQCCGGAVITRPQGDRAAAWQRVAGYWQWQWPEREAIAEESISRALQIALERLPDYDYLLVCGSFYLVGPVRALLR